MSDFEQQLRSAVQRGRATSQALTPEQEVALTEEQARRLHTRYRVTLSDSAEGLLKQLPNHLPGFRYETMFGDRGWGGACFRDDSRVVDGRRNDFYSRLEITVRPFQGVDVIEVTAKGTVHNKEVFQRAHVKKLSDLVEANATEAIRRWIVEYAEIYSRRSQ